MVHFGLFGFPCTMGEFEFVLERFFPALGELGGACELISPPALEPKEKRLDSLLDEVGHGMA